jgi:hypothetical protein
MFAAIRSVVTGAVASMLFPLLTLLAVAACGPAREDSKPPDRSAAPGQVSESGFVKSDTARAATKEARSVVHDPHSSESPAEDTAGGNIIVSRTGLIALTPDARMSVSVGIAPAVRSALRATGEMEQMLSHQVSDACVRMLRKANRPSSIVASPGTITNDGINVIVHLEIHTNRSGSPYEIKLTADQGTQRWSGYLERPSYRYVAGNIPILRNGTTPDGRLYWSPTRDTDMLAERLCDALLGNSGDTIPKSARPSDLDVPWLTSQP